MPRCQPAHLRTQLLGGGIVGMMGEQFLVRCKGRSMKLQASLSQVFCFEHSVLGQRLLSGTYPQRQPLTMSGRNAY
jgi:hypothetical protein